MDNDSKALNNNLFLKFLISPNFRLYRHLLLILFTALMVYYTKEPHTEPVSIYIRMIALSLVLFLFYVNMYWLIPKLLFNNRYLAYGIGILACIGIAYLNAIAVKHFFDPYLQSEDKRMAGNPPILFFIFIITVLIGASTAVKLFQRWIIDSKRINELETITVQSELEQLKNQINPHFLFNTLNNANVLTQKNPEKASQVLMKLSDLLRYQLYDSTRTKVLLTSDIHFLEDFLNLEKIRRDHFEFIVSKEGELSGVQVAPLLFICFVENAVKHNMDAEKVSFVDLFFKVKDHELIFHCINSKPLTAVADNRNGGLGLTNVKRRLELLYPRKHELIIRNNEDNFRIYLTIKL